MPDYLLYCITCSSRQQEKQPRTNGACSDWFITDDFTSMATILFGFVCIQLYLDSAFDMLSAPGTKLSIPMYVYSLIMIQI